MSDVLIRDEQLADLAVIRALTISAFDGKPYADGDEQDVIDRLRDCEELTISLVAEFEGDIVGHIAFSPAIVAGSQHWYALGPVSVRPDSQAKGIGAALVRAGLERLASRSAAGCILTGDPGYYTRFGFAVTPSLCPENEPGEYFQVKQLQGPLPDTPFRFHPAFYG